MALIVCPHCGEKVSDTVAVCIHCGASIKDKEPESMRIFEKMGEGEKNILSQQFQQAYHEYSFPQDRNRSVTKSRIAMAASTVVSAICLSLLIVRILVSREVIHFETEGDSFLIPGIILFAAILVLLISIVVWLTLRSSAKKSMRRYLLYIKIFQAWLSLRGIQYRPMFRTSEKKYKKYYMNINPNLYLKEEK